ncbi:MAG: NDP-sugar synthase [Synergistaceae bacterium]|nr:NDP-sugar synthase [Synergistaceae bacterium]
MKAVFLVGGMGTRLRPLTNKLPKPMVPVMGRPLLERNIEKLKQHGIGEIILCTCYRPESFEEYFDQFDFGIQIRYVQEDEPLGTGGAIKNAQQYLENDTCLVFNADIVNDIDFGKMLRFHKRKHADATIASVYVDDPTPYGVIECDENSDVISFTEKPKPHEIVSNYINAGVYIFEPDIFKMIPSSRVVSIEREIFPKLLEKGKRVAAYKGCTYWLDLGTPKKYMRLHRDIFDGKYAVGDADFAAEPILGLMEAKIHESAVLRGPVWLGEGVRIKAGAIVGPNAVVGANCVVGKKSAIENSVLWNNVELARNNRVSGSVITADCSVEDGLRIIKSVYTGEAQKRLSV